MTSKEICYIETSFLELQSNIKNSTMLKFKPSAGKKQVKIEKDCGLAIHKLSLQPVP